MKPVIKTIWDATLWLVLLLVVAWCGWEARGAFDAFRRGVPAASGQQSADSDPQSDLRLAEEPETGWWLTDSSGIRHNSNCRYYKSSYGRPCEKNAGTPCKLCGG